CRVWNQREPHRFIRLIPPSLLHETTVLLPDAQSSTVVGNYWKMRFPLNPTIQRAFVCDKISRYAYASKKP
ncbi:MAG: hypothetical protein ACKOCH_21235, partial [Bacteroidota bacterium]